MTLHWWIIPHAAWLRVPGPLGSSPDIGWYMALLLTAFCSACSCAHLLTNGPSSECIACGFITVFSGWARSQLDSSRWRMPG